MAGDVHVNLLPRILMLLAKATIQTQLQRAVLCLQCVTQTDITTKEAKTGVRSSLVPHAVLLMPLRNMKCTLMVSQHR